MVVRKLAEIIQIRLYGGQPSDDAPITLRQIAIEIIGEASKMAKQSFFENANFEGYNYASDEFITRYTGVSVAVDTTTDLKYCLIPAPIVGLPKSRGIVNIYPPFGYDIAYKKIMAKDVSIYAGSPSIPGVVLYWLEGGKIFFLPCDRTVPNNVVVSMIGQLGTLTEELNVPADALQGIEDMVYAKFQPVVNTPIDNANDNISIRDRQ